MTTPYYPPWWDDYYNLFDQLRQTKVCPKQIYQDYGKRASFILNYTCPIVVKKGGEPLDQLAQQHRFDSGDDLYTYILSYRPKYKELKEWEGR